MKPNFPLQIWVQQRFIRQITPRSLQSSEVQNKMIFLITNNFFFLFLSLWRLVAHLFNRKYLENVISPFTNG